MRRTVLLAIACALLAVTALAGPAPASPAAVGVWSAPFSEFGMFDAAPPSTPAQANALPTAVSMVMLPTGRIVYWDGLSDLADCGAPLAVDAGRCATNSRSRVLDLTGSGTPLFFTPSPERPGAGDLFCADQRLLPDGRVMAAGGTVWKNDPVDLSPYTSPGGPGGTAELFGNDETRYFSDGLGGGSWAVGSPMNHGRWYPTLVTLPSSKMFVASGVARLLYNDAGTNVHETETWDPATGVWSDNGPSGASSLPLFARMHLLPDGTVFYTGAGQMWSPFGQAYDEALWNIQQTYNPATNAWAPAGIGSYGARSGAFSVMLPLKPPYTTAKVLLAGGTLGTSPGSHVATDLSEVVTVSGGAALSAEGPRLNNRRWYSSGVALPDGTVLAFSGADADEVIGPGTEKAVRQAELFDGTQWIPLSSGARDRTYHNAAMLLPDGSVLVGGHSPINLLYGPKGDNSLAPAGTASNFKDPSFERFYPPYLFRGSRPSIGGVQKGVGWGIPFPIATADAASVTRVVLTRLPSVTHTTDADMRTVELPFVPGTGSLLAGMPGANVLPPGYYYLFVLTDNGSGETPSKAHIVRVGAAADVSGLAPAPFGI